MQGFFRGSSGLGLVIEDRPEIRQVANGVLLPELNRLGVNVDVVYGPPASDVSGVGRAMSGAVLRWNGRRDRVMFFTTYSIFALTFMRQAEAQQYRPKYGLDSSSTPQILAANLSGTRQLHGAVGLGVTPGYDSDPASWRVKPPGRTRCLQLVRSTGQAPAAGSVEETADMENCDLVFLLKSTGDVLVGQRRSLQRESFIDGVQELGSSFPAANIQRTRFAKGVRAGGSHYQRFAYDDTCSCFRYTTLPLPF